MRLSLSSPGLSLPPWCLPLLGWLLLQQVACRSADSKDLSAIRRADAEGSMAPLFGPSGKPEQNAIFKVTEEGWIESVATSERIGEIQWQSEDYTIYTNLTDVNGNIHTFPFIPYFSDPPEAAWFYAFVDASLNLIALDANDLQNGPPSAQRSSRLLHAIYGKSGFSTFTDNCSLVPNTPNIYAKVANESRILLSYAWGRVMATTADVDDNHVPFRLVNTSQNLPADLHKYVPLAVNNFDPAGEPQWRTVPAEDWYGGSSCTQLMWVEE